MVFKGKTTINSRVQVLILTTSGQEPTIPSPPTLTPNDPGFKNTDIVVGEFAFNSADDVWFYRKDNTIQKFLKYISLTQAEYDAIVEPDPEIIYIITDAPQIDTSVSFIEVTSLEYIATRDDAGPLKIINRNNANANTTTINNNVFLPGDIINIIQKGTGQSEIVPGSGVTFSGDSDASDDYKASGQNRVISLLCVASNEFIIYGALIVSSEASNINTVATGKFTSTDVQSFYDEVEEKLAANTITINHTSNGTITLNFMDRIRSTIQVNLSANATSINPANIASGGESTIIIVATGSVSFELSFGTLDDSLPSSTLNLSDGDVVILRTIYTGSVLYWSKF